jgi:CorA-like Mg2+ transporter protein
MKTYITGESPTVMGSTDEKIPQAQDSARYGRIILLLTIVTIIFLPMSFLATWFGMNIKDPVANSLNLHQIAAIIFPISIVIVLSALVFAFSERLRSFVVEGMENVLDFVLGALGTNRSIRSRRRRQKRRMRGQQRDIESGIVGESHECSVMAEHCRY